MKKIISFICLLACIDTMAQGKVTVGTGATVSIGNGAYLVVNNADLVNNGSLSAVSNGTVKFTGTNDAALSGNAASGMATLEVALGTAYKLTLQQNVRVTAEVRFTSGQLDLNNSILDLGSTGALTGEREQSLAFTNGSGTIRSTVMLNAPAAANPGNLGAVISSSANLGLVTVARGHVAQALPSTSGTSIRRYYDITPANNSGLNATLRLQYFDAELNGLNENNLDLWQRQTTWVDKGFTSRDASANYVERTGLDAFGRQTLADPGSTLPVAFTFVHTACANDRVIISWNTAAQDRVASFTVEESADGRSWREASTVSPVPGLAGNYSVSLATAATFFRVRENSLAGNRSYSGIIRSACAPGEGFSVWPIPVANKLLVSMTIAGDAVARIRLYDSKGALVQVLSSALLRGSNIVEVDMQRLPAGVYALQVNWNGQLQTRQIIKK